jgi:CDP-diacylglycerol---serine O-phosphatidyltransferase
MTVARSRIPGRRADDDDRPQRRELDPGVSFRPHLNLANLITTAGLAGGLSAGLLTASRGYALSGWPLWEVAGLILVAVLADLADGSTARHFGTDKDPFGHGLDSLADTVSFAAVPALAVYVALLHRAPGAGFLAAMMWGICGTGRLARYLRRGHRPGYIGCPAPLAAMVLMLLTAIVRQIAGEGATGFTWSWRS